MIGEDDYNPTLPNVYKLDSQLNRLARDLRAYVDDLRVKG